MANIVGISKFWVFFGLAVPIGIIPYPITFLVTDLISELYGRARANFVVFVGLIVNIFLLIVMTIAAEAPVDPQWLSATPVNEQETFQFMYSLMMRGTFASMFAYLLAQFIDVRIFHLIKEKTAGKHLWLRNNVSTLVSQLIDTTAVITVTFIGVLDFPTILTYIGYGYIFKVCFALADTPFFYLGVKFLTPFVQKNIKQ